MTDFELLGKAYDLLQQVFEFQQFVNSDDDILGIRKRLKEKEEAGGIDFDVLVANCHGFIESKYFSQAVHNNGDENWFELVSEIRRIVYDLKNDRGQDFSFRMLCGRNHGRALETPIRQLKIIWETAELNKINSGSNVPGKNADANPLAAQDATACLSESELARNGDGKFTRHRVSSLAKKLGVQPKTINVWAKKYKWIEPDEHGWCTVDESNAEYQARINQ